MWVECFQDAHTLLHLLGIRGLPGSNRPCEDGADAAGLGVEQSFRGSGGRMESGPHAAELSLEGESSGKRKSGWLALLLHFVYFEAFEAHVMFCSFTPQYPHGLPA